MLFAILVVLLSANLAQAQTALEQWQWPEDFLRDNRGSCYAHNEAGPLSRRSCANAVRELDLENETLSCDDNGYSGGFCRIIPVEFCTFGGGTPDGAQRNNCDLTMVQRAPILNLYEYVDRMILEDGSLNPEVGLRAALLDIFPGLDVDPEITPGDMMHPRSRAHLHRRRDGVRTCSRLASAVSIDPSTKRDLVALHQLLSLQNVGDPDRVETELLAAIHPASREAEAICLLTDRLFEVLRAHDLHDERIRVENATTPTVEP